MTLIRKLGKSLESVIGTTRTSARNGTFYLLIGGILVAISSCAPNYKAIEGRNHRARIVSQKDDEEFRGIKNQNKIDYFDIKNSPFIRSLDNTFQKDQRSQKKVEYLVMTYLTLNMANEGGRIDNLEKILRMKIPQDQKLIDREFQKVFENYGEWRLVDYVDSMKWENTFIKNEIPKRAENILIVGDYYPEDNPPWGEIFMDIAKQGTAQVIKRGGEEEDKENRTIEVSFGTQKRYYKRKFSGDHYQSVPQDFRDTDEYKFASPARQEQLERDHKFDNQKNLGERMKREGQIYNPITFVKLDSINTMLTWFPVDFHPRDGKFDAEQVSLSINAILKAIANSDSVNSFIDLGLKTKVIELKTNGVVAEQTDGIKGFLPKGTDLKGAIETRVYTTPFHMNRGDTTDYLIEGTVKNNRTGQESRTARIITIPSPEGTLRTPYFESRILGSAQGKPSTKDLMGILKNFQISNNIKINPNQENILYLWSSAQNLTQTADTTYTAEVDVFITESDTKNKWNERVRIGRSYSEVIGPKGDTLWISPKNSERGLPADTLNVDPSTLTKRGVTQKLKNFVGTYNLPSKTQDTHYIIEVPIPERYLTSQAREKEYDIELKVYGTRTSSRETPLATSRIEKIKFQKK